VLSADRQLPPAAIDEHGQRDARRPSIVEDLVHGCAHRAPAIEHVVDEKELAAVDVERDLGPLRVVLQAARRVIVAVEGDVHQPERRAEAEQRMQSLGEPCAAGVEPDHGALRPDARLQLRRELRAELFGLR
jgi:hypothetical protein